MFARVWLKTEVESTRLASTRLGSRRLESRRVATRVALSHVEGLNMSYAEAVSVPLRLQVCV